MKKASAQMLLQVAASLLSLAAVVNSDNSGTEFGGGTITGQLTTLNLCGGLLFIAALILTFIYRRFTAVGALLASLLCLPLYVYLTATGIVQRIIPGEYSAPAQWLFYWDDWALAGIFMLIVTACIYFRSFRSRSRI